MSYRKVRRSVWCWSPALMGYRDELIAERQPNGNYEVRRALGGMIGQVLRYGPRRFRTVYVAEDGAVTFGEVRPALWACVMDLCTGNAE